MFLFILLILLGECTLSSQSAFKNYIGFSISQRILADGSKIYDGAINESFGRSFKLKLKFINTQSNFQYGFGGGIGYINQAQHVIPKVCTGFFINTIISSESRTLVLDNTDLHFDLLLRTPISKRFYLLFSPELSVAIVDNSKLASLRTYHQENNRIEKTYIKDQNLIGLSGLIGLEYDLENILFAVNFVYTKRKSKELERNIDSGYLNFSISFKI